MNETLVSPSAMLHGHGTVLSWASLAVLNCWKEVGCTFKLPLLVFLNRPIKGKIITTNP